MYTHTFAQFVKGQSEYHILAKFRGSLEQKPILCSFISLQNSIHCNLKHGWCKLFNLKLPERLK